MLLEHFDAALEADVLVVVSDLCLGARRVNRFRQLVTLIEAFRKLDPAYRAVLLIAGPAAARYISAHNTLDRQHLKLLAEHAVSVVLLLPEKLRHVSRVEH